MKLCELFNKKQARVIDMTQGRGWGCTINFHDNLTDVHGWLTPIVKNGDCFKVKMKSGRIGIYKLENVRNCTDPRDMFFASAKLISYE